MVSIGQMGALSGRNGWLATLGPNASAVSTSLLREIGARGSSKKRIEIYNIVLGCNFEIDLAAPCLEPYILIKWKSSL